MASLRRNRPRGKGVRVAALARIFLTVVTLTACLAGTGFAQLVEDHPYFPDEYQIREDRGSATISVVRDSTAGVVTVTYSTKPSDAKEGIDYQPVLGELAFGEGERGPKSFKVPILDDPEPEEDETVLLLLYNARGEAIDFGELVIVSDERVPEETDQGPGSPVDNAAPGTSGARTGNPAAGGPARPGSGAGAAGEGSSQAPLAPGEIPTIVLGQAPAQAQESALNQQDGNDGRSPLAADAPGASGPIKLLLGLSAAAALAGGAALFWLRRREEPPSSP